VQKAMNAFGQLKKKKEESVKQLYGMLDGGS